MMLKYPEIKNIWQGIVSLPGLEMRQLPQTQMEPPNSTNLKASILELNFWHNLKAGKGTHRLIATCVGAKVPPGLKV